MHLWVSAKPVRPKGRLTAERKGFQRLDEGRRAGCMKQCAGRRYFGGVQREVGKPPAQTEVSTWRERFGLEWPQKPF